MQQRQLLFACLLAIAAAVAAWWLWPNGEQPTPPADRSANTVVDAGGDPAQARGPSPENGNTPTRTVARSRDDEPAEPRLLLVRLRGRHADAPWTSNLRMELQDRSRSRVQHEEHAVESPVDAEGRCRLVLPEWWQPGRMVRLSIQGRQASYRDLIHRERGGMTFADELVLDVQPVGELSGFVRDRQNEPVRAARVAAYQLRDGRPVGKAVGETGTDHNGFYRLLAPPDVPLFVVAVPMQPQVMRWRRIDGVNDNGQLRADLLPTARDARLHVLRSQPGFDFVVPDAAVVHGTVQHPDGRPASWARVHLTAASAATAGATSLDLSGNATLTVLADRTLAVSGDVPTDDDGRYALPAVPGQQILVQILSVQHTRILGHLPLQSATAPARVDVELPYATTARAVYDNELQPHARLLTRQGTPMRFEKDGTRQLLVAQPTAVRADRGGLRSEWQVLPVADDHTTVDLVLTDSLVELAIEIEAEHPVRNASFSWTRSDGQRGREVRRRGDGDGPFHVHLEPGTYQLRIGPAAGERNGNYILPIEQTVTVGSTPGSLTVKATFGGKFACHALDEQGRHLPGTVLARSPNGTEYRAVMKRGGKPGELDERDVSTFAGVLPPGPYEVEFDLGPRGVHKRYVQILEREVMPVRVQL